MYLPGKYEESKKAEARKKFDLVTKAFVALHSDERRNNYLRTGAIDLSGLYDDRFWQMYFRNLYKKIHGPLLEAFVEIYKGSEEEKRDLARAYKRHNGNYDDMLITMIMGEKEDIPRYREMIEGMIAAGELKLEGDTANNERASTVEGNEALEPTDQPCSSRSLVQRNESRNARIRRANKLRKRARKYKRPIRVRRLRSWYKTRWNLRSSFF
ncbi:hypothetical protein TTRE_0000296301 [Trichuris trichiura]|uniref:DNAJC9 HTH domain-containing protein n=1 Tax=Trichuris trichiura TaxID=36087 RepID=A0A077Z4Y4_TRITR|nr:hypothetical protein TTRE_0000296301 [Trichuris trichiura]